MLPSIKQHAKSHDLVPDKKLGQNFLFDQNLCDKIVRSAGFIEGKTVVEIGPGPGGLSRSILSAGIHKLIAIEKDHRCLRLLEEIKDYYKCLEIIEEDALKVKLSSLNLDKVTIIANLPYNIGTELLMNWLDEIEYVDSITIMLQKEVVDRICSKPSTKSYGRLSIACQLICDIEKQFDVLPSAFFPPPKVTSSIVKLIPKEKQLTKDKLKAVNKIASLAFNQRRKMLKSSLKSLGPELDKILEKCSINPQARAENLTPEDYLRLALALM